MHPANPLTWAGLIVWLGALGTLAVFSFLFKENRAYRFAEHILLGLGIGFELAGQRQHPAGQGEQTDRASQQERGRAAPTFAEPDRLDLHGWRAIPICRATLRAGAPILAPNA